MIFENFSPVTLAPRLKDEDYFFGLNRWMDNKNNVGTHKKLGVNDTTIGVNECIFSSQDDPALYSWKKVKAIVDGEYNICDCHTIFGTSIRA